jgi:hypothetical protein
MVAAFASERQAASLTSVSEGHVTLDTSRVPPCTAVDRGREWTQRLGDVCRHSLAANSSAECNLNRLRSASGRAKCRIEIRGRAALACPESARAARCSGLSVRGPAQTYLSTPSARASGLLLRDENRCPFSTC